VSANSGTGVSDAPATAASARVDWSSVGERGHGVQFYADDGQLLDVLTRYVGTALITADVAVVLGTASHRRALERALKSRGLDIHIATRQGRYIAADAHELLAKILRDGWPDEKRFASSVGSLVKRAVHLAAKRRLRVVVFGELVALVWSAARPAAALRLEELWNDLARSEPFALCCAYPMNGFSVSQAAPFLRVCAQHTHVFPAPHVAAADSA